MRIPVFTLAAGILILDQSTKQMIIQSMPLNTTRPVLPFFSLTHVRNTGAAFGIFPDGNLFFIVAGFLILAGLVFFHKRLVSHSAFGAVGVSCLWGGALGNLVDRIKQGSVTDFLDFYAGRWHWPAFNVADSAICVGVFLLFLDSLLTRQAVSSPILFKRGE